LGFGGESLPVFSHASGRTEMHVPVAMNSEAKFTATVIATQIQDWTQIVASVIRYKSIDAHHKPPASAGACSISISVSSISSGIKHQNDFGALPKKHIQDVVYRAPYA
jgi:hypothetical protein